MQHFSEDRISRVTWLAILFVVVLSPALNPVWSNPLPSGNKKIDIESLEEVAKQRSDHLIAIEKNIAALKSEIRARDLELSPTLNTQFNQSVNHKATTSSLPNGDKRYFDLALEQNFSTGTAARLSVRHNWQDSTQQGVSNEVEWDVRLAQSLWRNSLGRAVRLRQSRDAAEWQAQLLTGEHQRQTFLVDLEGGYWELVLARKEQEIGKENLKRSESLLSWIRDRVRRSAAEVADLLQIEALVLERQLQLTEVESRIQATLKKLQNLIPGYALDVTAIDEASLEFDGQTSKRLTPSALAVGYPASAPIRWDALAAHWTAQKLQDEAQRIDDLQKPILDFYVSYGQNGIHNNLSEAWDRATGRQYSETQIGLSFITQLDAPLKEEQRLSARLKSEGQALSAAALKRDSQTDWAELVRNLDNLKKQRDMALQLAQLQVRKSLEERKRYQMGRSTAFQAISFESEAATAQLRKYRIMAEIKKLEARVRLFTFEGEGR